LNKKYVTLKEQIQKLFRKIEEDKFNKEEAIDKNNEDLKNFELKIKSILINDQNNLKKFADNLILKIESKISNMNSNFKNENNLILDILEKFKDNFQVNKLD